jgi:putative hydrolase of the HAD superfamily
MILIFDLDDTLYPEHTFVESGLRAVAAHGRACFGWDAEASFSFMCGVLKREGRGRIFDRWLEAHRMRTQKRVDDCVRIYRHHRPTLSLYPAAERLLAELPGAYPLYLVTDGHKIVQRNKVDALAISCAFKRVFITHRFGLKHAKPSTYCFERIRAAEHSNWEEMIYIGDNPAKDFVNLNRVGMHTIRVLTGAHRTVEASAGYDARHRIQDLDGFIEVLDLVSGTYPADRRPPHRLAG